MRTTCRSPRASCRQFCFRIIGLSRPSQSHPSQLRAKFACALDHSPCEVPNCVSFYGDSSFSAHFHVLGWLSRTFAGILGKARYSRCNARERQIKLAQDPIHRLRKTHNSQLHLPFKSKHVRIQGFKPKLRALAGPDVSIVRHICASLGCLRPSGSNRLNLVTDFAVHSLLALGRTAQVLSFCNELPKPQGFNRFNRCHLLAISSWNCDFCKGNRSAVSRNLREAYHPRGIFFLMRQKNAIGFGAAEFSEPLRGSMALSDCR